MVEDLATDHIPDEILETMASAMLEPGLGKEADALGNKVRKEVLKRALRVVYPLGWELANYRD